MARFDIMPYSPNAAGKTRVHTFEMNSGVTTVAPGGATTTGWNQGELLVLDEAVGDIDVVAPNTTSDPGTLTTRTFVAAAGAADLIQRYNSTSGAADHNVPVPVYSFYEGDEFVTRHCFDSGAPDTDVGPAGTNAMTNWLIGVDGDPRRTNTVNTHGFTNAGDYCVLLRILNGLGQDTLISGGTAFWLVFAHKGGV